MRSGGPRQRKVLSRLRLRFNAVDGLNEFCARWWGGVLKYDDPYPVTLTPKDICTLLTSGFTGVSRTRSNAS